MENLKRYAPQLGNGINYMGMGEVKEGAWVKFSDIKEFLTTAYNNSIAPLSCKGCVNTGTICYMCIRNATTDNYDNGAS